MRLVDRLIVAESGVRTSPSEGRTPEYSLRQKDGTIGIPADSAGIRRTGGHLKQYLLSHFR